MKSRQATQLEAMASRGVAERRCGRIAAWLAVIALMMASHYHGRGAALASTSPDFFVCGGGDGSQRISRALVNDDFCDCEDGRWIFLFGRPCLVFRSVILNRLLAVTSQEPRRAPVWCSRKKQRSRAKTWASNVACCSRRVSTMVRFHRLFFSSFCFPAHWLFNHSAPCRHL